MAVILQRDDPQFSYDWLPSVYDSKTDDSFVSLAEGPPPVPELLVKLLGLHFFADGDQVHLEGRQVTDRRLAALAAVTGPISLYLVGHDVTDATLSHPEGLTSLHDVRLLHTGVAKEGVQKLKRALPDCEVFIWPPLPP